MPDIGSVPYSTRRTVRATQWFFEDLDRQLPAERGPAGQPSTNDFQVFELLRIVERFAIGFDELPRLIPGRDDYRILIAVGVLLLRFSVVGELAPDGPSKSVQHAMLALH
jgi:hypothetical protein